VLKEKKLPRKKQPAEKKASGKRWWLKTARCPHCNNLN